MIVFKFINKANDEIVTNGKKLECSVHQQHEERINLKPSELPMDLSRKGKEGEITKRLFQIKQEEIIHAISRNVGITVQNDTGEQTEYKIDAKSNKGNFQRGLINTWEEPQSHGKDGDHQDEGMLQYKMHVPEAEGAGGLIGQQNGNQCARKVGDETELEEAIAFEGDRDQIQIRRQITKLNGKTGNAKSHQIQGIVMEKQNDCQEHAEHIALLSGTEAEDEIKSKGGDCKDCDPNHMEIRSSGCAHLGISDQGLRCVHRHHQQNNSGDGKRKIEPLPTVLHAEDMAVTNLNKNGKSDGNCQLRDKVAVSKFGIQMKPSALVGEEIRHEVIEKHGAENRKGETYV